MNKYLQLDPWRIIEAGLHPENNRFYESIMSLGNGYMGLRGNFEENYSGGTLQGTYIAGVYYPDKTRVGWWKNGYPEYFAKVLNAANFIGIKVTIDGEELDLSKSKVKNFHRILDMKDGVLERQFTIIDKNNGEILIKVKRFLSIVNKEIGAISYSITPLNHDTKVIFMPYIDGNVTNEDSNYNEMFWETIERDANNDISYLTMKTKKLDFYVATAMKCCLTQDDLILNCSPKIIDYDGFVGNSIDLIAPVGKTTTLYKYISVTNNRYIKENKLVSECKNLIEIAYNKGFENILQEHSNAWSNRWQNSDIFIDGDVSSQQGIRFNIFQLNQTYSGDDSRLNIGPKGFTGEKYGGSTYWDTEAFCLPFYLSTCDQAISRNLLIYRYNHLEKAKDNAKKLGLKGALFPMVTMNGEECHNEWEITFEEIHRNAAISYAIFNYVRYTGDEMYLAEYGFEVLVETSRFWASRVNYNPFKDKYMILGVTGPNEYENNVNNNWYTNKMAAWSLRYTLEVQKLLQTKYPETYNTLSGKLHICKEECALWMDIIDKMYFPYIENVGVFEQQDGYMDKDLLYAKDIPKSDLPLNQHWSWDRILRSCFIKQADVIQGLFFLNDEFDFKTKKSNFDFYEPRTVHESSLSPCVHSIVASELGYYEKAYELFLRTSRLDLDNYNNDTDDGLHITSMAGTWMSIVYGFGGMKVINGILNFKPFIPESWKSYSFKVLFRQRRLMVKVLKNNILISLENGDELVISILDKYYTLTPNAQIEIEFTNT